MFEERLRGGLWGLLVGDAFGVPYEFHLPASLPDPDALAMVPPVGFARAHQGVPPGTWSDDGAQALALLDVLTRDEGWSLEAFADALVAWYTEGAYAVDGFVFDIGVQTTKALHAYMGGRSPERSGPSGEWDNGNGSLMRVLPVALWCTGPDDELVALAEEQSLVTHGHPRTLVACGVYMLWARRLLHGQDADLSDAVDAARAVYAGRPDRMHELETFYATMGEPNGSGYVVDSLHSAAWALRRPSYEAVIRAAVSLGNDTDTTACIAGGLAGIRHGVAGIPASWRGALRGRELLDPLVDRLIAARRR